jgi:hypothetical protein
VLALTVRAEVVPGDVAVGVSDQDGLTAINNSPRLPRVGSPEGQVAGGHHDVGTAPRDVRQHCFAGRQIAVDVREDGDPHEPLWRV